MCSTAEPWEGGAGEPPATRLTCGSIVLDTERRLLTCQDRPHHLTPKESQLLEAFLRYQGQVLSRQFLMKLVWDTDFVQDTRTLEVHVHWLRQKIEDGTGQPHRIHTVRGVGYVFRPDAAPDG